jgi:hypothetical protein
MSRAVILLTLAPLLACARAGFSEPRDPPGPECTTDEGCERNQRCDNGECVTCELPAFTDPCVSGTCYYIAPSGGDDGATGGSPQTAWDSFAHAWTVLQPGDTLVLLDGVYATSLEIAVSGTHGAPVTIRAHNDGGAILDGEFSRWPCELSQVSHVVLEGVGCRNLSATAMSAAVLSIMDSSDITVRRVTVAGSNTNSSLVRVAASSDVLIEDTAAWGTADNVYLALDSSRITLRRCWAELPAILPVNTAAAVYVRTSSDSRIENCVVVQPGGLPDYSALGFNVAGSGSVTADGNAIHGNVTIDLPGWSYRTATSGIRMEGNRFTNNVAVRSVCGFFQRADADLIVDRQTSVNGVDDCVGLRATTPVTYDSDFAIHGNFNNSICLGGSDGFSVVADGGVQPTFDHDYNVLFGVADPYSWGCSQSPQEMVDTVEPHFDTTTYGDGAYLIPPVNLIVAGATGGPIGAEVLYRYQDGELTCMPLWPWPMEERILAERGISVTWEAGGGLWRTLDGVYP